MVAKQNDEVILICALRYALGRRTYVTSVVSEFIMEYADLIDINLVKVMIKDIESCDDLGDECDKRNWEKLLSVLKERVKND